MNEPKPKRVAVVIGSGSVKCAAAVGLQHALVRAGIHLDMVVGCSGGSMYAAVMALGYDAPTIAEMTRELWTREITHQRSYRDFFSILAPGPLGFSEDFGMIDDRLVMQRLTAAFGERTFADAKIPLYIAATDFATGEQVVFSSGRLLDAVRGSIAMPYIFKPYRVGGRLLVDGYLSDPMPVGIAMKNGADIILALGFDTPYQSRVNSLLRFAFQINSIMSNNLFRANFAFHNLAHHNEIIPIVPQFNQRIGLFDTDKIPYIIEEGERATEEQIPYLKRLLEIGAEDAAATAATA